MPKENCRNCNELGRVGILSASRRTSPYSVYEVCKGPGGAEVHKQLLSKWEKGQSVSCIEERSFGFDCICQCAVSICGVLM